MKAGSYIIFELENELFGIPASRVIGIIEGHKLSIPILRVPNYLGSVHFQGKVIPVVDTRSIIGLRQKKSENILVVDAHSKILGLGVDSLRGTVDLTKDELIAAGQTGFYVSRMNGQAVLLFLPNLMIPERVVLEALAEAAG